MNRFLLSAAVGSLALLALTCRGYAQDQADARQNAAAQDKPPQRYEVEIILFANTDGNPNEELFSAEAQAPSPAATPLPLQPLPAGEGADELRSLPGGTATPPTAGSQTVRRPNARAPSTDGLQPIPDVAPGDASAGGVSAGAAAGGDASASAPAEAFRFRLLKPDEMKLDKEYAKIERLGAYRSLGHAAWIQEGLPEDQARPIDMTELGIANPSGTIQLHVSRYLHVSVNLTYRADAADANAPANAPADTAGTNAPANASADANAPADAAQPDGVEGTGDASGLSPVTVAQRYIMHQQRRIRSGQLQYFDHPMFGLLLLVTPAPQKAPEQPADGNGALSPAA